MKRAVGIYRIDGEVITYAAGNAETQCIGGCYHFSFGIEYQKTYTTRTRHGKHRVGLQVGIVGRFCRIELIGGELSKIAALANPFRVASLLACCCQETAGQNVVGTVLHKEESTVLGVFGNLFQRAVDICFPNRHGMLSIIIHLQVRDGLEEAPGGEEIGQVLLCYLTYLADKLQACLIGVAVSSAQWVTAQFLEKGGVERGVLLCLMIIEIQLVVHAHLAVEASREEGFMARMFLHHSGERRAFRRDESVQVAYYVREEIVRHLCTTFQTDDSLIVVSAFMCRTPIVEVSATHIERG